MTDDTTDRPAAGPERRRPPRRPAPRPRQPDHAARRMLVSTVAIAAVIAAGVGIWSWLGGDGDGDGQPTASWNRIVLVDRTTGAVTFHDRDGEELERVPGTGRVNEVIPDAERIVLVGPDEIRIVRPGEDPIAVPIPTGSDVVPIATSGPLRLAVDVTDPSGGPGDLLIVDTEDGSTIDVAAAAAPTEPRLFVETLRASRDGTRFAVADANNFQTIVVGAEIDGAAFLADQPVAVGDDLIATSQVVNRQADISLVDLERRAVAVVPTELPSGGIMIDDELLMVSVDGGIFRIRDGDRDAEELGRITVPAGAAVRWTAPSYRDERLIVGGSDFVAVIDLDGAVVAQIDLGEPMQVEQPAPGWRCLPVFDGQRAHSIIDLGSGGAVADLTDSLVVDVSWDGCAVVTERAGALQLVDRDGTVALPAARDVTIAPDGRGVVRTTTAGRTEYVELTGDRELADPIELAGAPVNHTVAFLDD